MVIQPCLGRPKAFLFGGYRPVPVRLPGPREERHEFSDAFQALFQRGVAALQFLQGFIRPAYLLGLPFTGGNSSCPVAHQGTF